MKELCDKAKFMEWILSLKPSFINDDRSGIYREKSTLFGGKKKLGLRAWISQHEGKIDSISISNARGIMSCSTWVYTSYNDCNRFDFTAEDLKKIYDFAFKPDKDLASKFFGV